MDTQILFAEGMTFDLSLFDRKTDNKAKPATMTWPQICQMYENPDVRFEKDGPLFSPATFEPQIRAKANVKKGSLLIYDIDHNANLAEILSSLDKLNCAYIVASTHSHLRQIVSNPNAEARFRIVIPLAVPVAGDHFADLWHDIANQLGLPIDRAAKDESRMYYKPAHVNGMPYCCKITPGAFLEWTPTSRIVVPPLEPKRAKPVGTQINNGSRNATLTSLAGSMQRRGVDKSTIRAALLEENRLKCDPPLAREEIERIVESIGRYEPAVDKRRSGDSGSMFKIKGANEWIKESSDQPMPTMLLGPLWNQGELALIFSDTGLGKTIFGVQSAEKIGRGDHTGRLPCNTEPQKVLYFDFELSAKQWEGRYSRKGATHYHDPYEFSDNLIRIEIDPNAFDPGDAVNYDNYILSQIELAFAETGAKVGFIDNITYLGRGTETAKDALPLMKGLNSLKKRLGLSLAVFAHTPKRDLSRPLTINDMTGSKMLANFADSIVAIGASCQDKNIRYIKQVKVRSDEITYDADNVLTCQVVKKENFLMYDFLGTGCEREHLKGMTEETRGEVIRKAKDLENKGLSQRRIAEELSISIGTVNKYLRQ